MLLVFSSIYSFLSWWVAGKTEKNITAESPPAPVIETTSVVVARFDIPAQTVITSEMLEVKELPEELVTLDAITEISEALEVSAKTTIFAGDVITRKKLTTDLNSNAFTGQIPANCRAVSIAVNEITGVDGFAKPGDKVDLLLVETSADKSVNTRVFLQDVLLLSVNQSISQTNEEIEEPSVATFAVYPQEVLRLVAASKLGEIYMVLRPPNPSQKYFDNLNYKIASLDASNKIKQEKDNLEKLKKELANLKNLPPIPENKIEDSSNEKENDENKIEIIQGDKVIE